MSSPHAWSRHLIARLFSHRASTVRWNPGTVQVWIATARVKGHDPVYIEMVGTIMGLVVIVNSRGVMHTAIPEAPYTMQPQ